MDNPLTNFDNVTVEKVDFIEAQVQKNLEFRLESMKILSDQAMVTLNWLFALAVTPAGFVFSKATEIEWWIAIPALLCSIASGATAVYLFENALKMKSIIPAGNEPKSLLSDGVMELTTNEIRVLEICNNQDRIEIVAGHNEKAGTAINNARIAIIAITGGCILLLGVLYVLDAFLEC